MVVYLGRPPALCRTITDRLSFTDRLVSMAPINNPTTASSSTKDHATADAIQTQIDISVSKARSVIASWLPANTLSTAYAANEDSDTDEDLFKPAPPRQAFSYHPPASNVRLVKILPLTSLGREYRIGVGAPIPASLYTQGRAGKDALRRNMLGGRKPTKEMPETARQCNRSAAQPDDSDEDTGRSALGGCKRKRPANDLRRGKIARTETPNVKIPTPDTTPEIKTETASNVLQLPKGILESSDVALSSKKKKRRGSS
jgi:hypothetical protein